MQYKKDDIYYNMRTGEKLKIMSHKDNARNAIIKDDSGQIYDIPVSILQKEPVRYQPSETEEVKKDSINPDHYKVGGIETWDYLKAKLTPTELAGAVKFNVIKYISRANHKGKAEDLKKAKWYLDNLIKEIEKDGES